MPTPRHQPDPVRYVIPIDDYITAVEERFDRGPERAYRYRGRLLEEVTAGRAPEQAARLFAGA